MVIYLYERSTCRYVGLNALNLLHIHGPCFNAPYFWMAFHKFDFFQSAWRGVQKGAVSILSWFGRRKRDVTLEENEENIMKAADVDKDGALVC